MFSSISSFISSFSRSSASDQSGTLHRPVMSSTPSTYSLSPSAANPYYPSFEAAASTVRLTLPTPVYSPGMRTMSTATLSPVSSTGDAGSSQTGHSSIQLQDFHDGMPPAPPVALSWARITRWAEKNYPELSDQINGPATAQDIDLIEKYTELVLPADVRESFLQHDGQERGGKPCGLIFGVTILDSDEVMAEWDLWRSVARAIHQEQEAKAQAAARATTVAAAQASSSRDQSAARHPKFRKNDFTAHQTCVPEHAIQPVYAHVGWLPLAKDYNGNNLAIDLAPGPNGNWGQVILFGREFDKKYVVARSWAHFLAMLADDFEDGRWSVDEDSEELWYVSGGKMHYYFDVLKRRRVGKPSDQSN